jgi:hypothetical protein
LANPLLYAHTLTKRMDRHLQASSFDMGAGNNSSSSTQALGEPWSPNAAVQQLDRYLSGHETLQRKAGGTVMFGDSPGAALVGL